MDASVTLKLSPHEFDLIRTAVEVRAKQQHERGASRPGAGLTVESIRASRTEALYLTDILKKLRGA